MINTDFEEIRRRINELYAVLEKYPGASLMAVTKTRTNEEIAFASNECGISLFGENRSNELLSHKEAFGGGKVHFIGTPQKNKMKYLVGCADVIETVDSIETAAEIGRLCLIRNVTADIFIEVNTGREEQKSGIMPEELPSLLYKASSIPSVRVCGLMTVPPRTESGAESRKYFSLLRRLRDENAGLFSVKTPLLSMGMTDSYREALDEGSDIIRIGTGIFGPRDYQNK